MDVLEYLVRLRGAGEAAAQMRGLAAETKAATGEMVGMGKAGGAGIALAGKAILGIGAAAIGVGLEAVKMSTAFNHEMLRIRTDAGASSQELANMKTGVLDLARSGASMGQGPMSLAQGLYHLESLGIRGSKALEALKLASQESAISGANLEQTTTALGAAMYVGIKGTGDLTQLMGTLNATVGAGNMRFQDLVEALGTGVLPSAKVAGLGIQDVSAALAVATDSGYQASSAAAQLGTAFHFLYAPTDKATTALKSIGMTHDQLAQDMHKPRGLLVALTDLRDHLQGLSKVQQAQVLNAILPGGRGRILLTELTMLDRLKGKYDQINKTAGGFTGSVAAQRHDPGTQLKMGEARIQADMIALGNVLTPIVIPALAGLLNVGAQVIEWLTALPKAIESVIGWFKGLGGGVKDVSGGVSGHMRGMAQSVMAVTGPFVDLWHTVSHVADGIGTEAQKLWVSVSKAFDGIVTAARSTFNAGFVKDLITIAQSLANAFGWIFGAMVKFIQAVLPGIVTAFRGIFQAVKGVVEFFAGLFTGDIGKMWKGIEDIFGGAFGVVVGMLKQFGGVISLIASQVWDGLKSGLIDVVNFIIKIINTALIAPINAVSNSIPIIGGNVVNPIGSISTGSSSAPVPAGSAHAAPVGGRGHMQGLTPGAAWRHGDIVLKVGPDELARVHRKQILNAMAAGA